MAKKSTRTGLVDWRTRLSKLVWSISTTAVIKIKLMGKYNLVIVHKITPLSMGYCVVIERPIC